ncbi:MAG: FtsX-like permease family protein [Fibrobacterota bacterium]
MKFEFFIARRYFSARRKVGFISAITYVSVGGVTLGVAALIIALSIMNGFEDEVRSRIVGTNAHFKVLKYHNGIIKDYNSLLDTVLQYCASDVTAGAPFIQDKAAVSSKTVRDGFLCIGIHPEKEKYVTEIEDKIVYGEFNLGNASYKDRELPGIILGYGLADHIRAGVGDLLTLMSLKVDSKDDLMSFHPPKMKQFVLTGIFETGMYEYDTQMGYIGLEPAKQLFQTDGGVTGLHFRTKDIFTAEKTAASVKDVVDYPHYVFDWKAQNKTLFAWMKVEKRVVFIVICLIVLVAAFNIISSLIMTVMEKTREIGILRSMGAGTGVIRKIFMVEGIMIGLIGTATGLFLGLGLCFLQVKFNLIPLPGDIYFISSVPVKIIPVDIVVVIAAVNIICFLATVYPAFKASKLYPAEALRYE